MTERLTSFFIFLGGILAVLALWYLSVVFVRRDTRRRGGRELERQVWIAVAVVLPLFGFALYLFVHLLRGYLQVPPEPPVEAHITAVKARPADWQTPAPAIPETAGGTLDGAAVLEAERTNLETPSAAGEPPGEASVYQTNPADSNSGAASTTGADTEFAARLPLRGRFLLIASQGPYAGQQFEFQHLPLEMGRGAAAGIALDDDLNVSRSHAELYARGGELRIRDLDSLHGTQINGVPVSDQIIQPGDRISVGGTTLIFRELP